MEHEEDLRGLDHEMGLQKDQDSIVEVSPQEDQQSGVIGIRCEAVIEHEGHLLVCRGLDTMLG